MTDQVLEEYNRLLEQLVNLQQKLLKAFEAEVKVVSLDVHKRFAGGQLKDILVPYHTITDVLQMWPEGVSVLPLVTWAGPMTGIVQVEGQNWFFHIHGYLEVHFVWLPSTLDEAVLTALKAGEMSVLKNLPEYGPEIDTAYFGRGRTDGITAHSVHGFAHSTGSTFGQLSQDKHEVLLEKLTEKGILIRVPAHAPNFVFASSKHLASENARPSSNATALGILKQLHSELRERRSDVNLSIQSEQAVILLPNQNKKLPELWEDLLRCLLAPITRSLLSGLLKTTDGGKTFCVPTLDKSMRLAQWVENITDFFSASPELASINFSLPPNFETIEIWRDGEDSDWDEWHRLGLTPHPSKIPEKQLRKIRSPYWNSLYVAFRSWGELVGVTLEQVNWNATQEVVEIIMRVKGPFDTIEDFYLKETVYPLRVVSLQPPQPHFGAETSEAILLISQLIAKQGRNQLSLVELLNNQLIVKLTLSRADSGLSYPPASFVTEPVIETILGYILAQIPPKYIEASQRLEIVLLEISQLASFDSNNDIKRLKNVLNELRLVREGITILGNDGPELFNRWFLNDYITAERPYRPY